MAKDLITDWVALIRRQNLKQSKHGRLQMLNGRDLSAQAAEVMFSLCDKFGLSFVAKHRALDCFERVLLKMLFSRSSSSAKSWRGSRRGSSDQHSKKRSPVERQITCKAIDVSNRLFHFALACVQLASKMENSKSTVDPGVVNEMFPSVTKSQAFASECEVLQLLNFDLGNDFSSGAACVEVLLFALYDLGLLETVSLKGPNKNSEDICELRNGKTKRCCIRLLDLAVLKKGPLLSQIKSGLPSAEGGQILLVAGAVAAATQLSRPDNESVTTEKVMSALDGLTGIQSKQIAVAAKCILQLLACNPNTKLDD